MFARVRAHLSRIFIEVALVNVKIQDISRCVQFFMSYIKRIVNFLNYFLKYILLTNAAFDEAVCRLGNLRNETHRDH